MLAASLATPAAAIEFDAGAGWRGQFDTTVSVGAAWRTQNRDPGLIAVSNGGASGNVNGDDGNLNYAPHRPIAAAIKLTHELDLRRDNVGVFTRASYFYDHYTARKDELPSATHRRLDHDAQLLDAYVFGNYRPWDRAAQLRLGNQVVSWGESAIIGNGINVLNPVDLTRLRVPGAEIKEALTPSPMLWGSLELASGLRLEAVGIARFRKVRLDPRGSFFSTDDTISEGGDFIYGGGGRRWDQHGPASPFVPGGANLGQVGAPRSADRTPSNGGEYGLALRWLLPQLNNTELGFYAIRYHSRTPNISLVRGGATAPAGSAFGCSVVDVRGLIERGPRGACTGIAPATYLADYVGGIRLYGLSFNTAGPAGLALQGEYAYRPNQPLQLNVPDLLNAGIGLGGFITGSTPRTNLAAADVAPGTVIQGYDRVRMHQAQIAATKVFPPAFGADQSVLLAEVGVTWLDLPAGRYYAGPASVYAPGANTALAAPGTPTDAAGVATRRSWGYRLSLSADYSNLIGALKVSPRLAFSHDVRGIGPTFNEGAKAATLGVSVGYREAWRADLAYTNFFGGRMIGTTSAYAPVDRDFVSFSVSYAF